MLICVSSKILGTKKHLLYHDGAYSWLSMVPDNAWVYGDESVIKSLDVLLVFFGIEKPTIENQQHIRSFKVISPDQHSIPWHAVLPAKQFQKALTSLISVLENALQCLSNSSYGKTFLDEREFLVNLSRAAIDIPLLSTYIAEEKNMTVKNTLATFRPLADKMTDNIRYNQAATLTGRLTVASGPHILTLAKKYRDIIKSRHPDGKIVQVDFVSLEPRVARYVSGSHAEFDVYTQLSNELFDSELTREQAKIAVLCALYGVSSRRLSKMLGTSFNAQSVISEIKRFFGVFDLLKGVQKSLASTARFKNWFGREIEPDRSDDGALVNYYIQSTACDVALLGFIDLYKKIQKSNIRANPIFVIHDALILDIHSNDEEPLRELLAGGAVIPTLGSFPASLSIIKGSGV